MFIVGNFDSFNGTDMVLYLIDIRGGRHITFFKKSNWIAYWEIMQDAYRMRLDGLISERGVMQMEHTCQRLMGLFCK